jgi:hypothetical protein
MQYCPRTQVVMIAIANRMIIPGIIPSVSKTSGIESTPSPICVFIMRIDVPIQPTYVRYKDWCLIGHREFNLHLGTIEQHLSACHLMYHPKLRHATHIWTTFLDVTKDGISDTNAPATCAEAALYDFTILLRLLLGKMVQPLIVFVVRHCDRIDRAKQDVNEQKPEQLSNERVRAVYWPRLRRRGSHVSLYVVSTSVALGPSHVHACLTFNLRTYVTINPSCSGGV